MTAKQKRSFSSLLALIFLSFAVLAWLNHVPEPHFNGRGLHNYLEDSDQTQANLAVLNLGSAAVPYLTSVIKRDPLRELIYSAAEKNGHALKFLHEDQVKYRTRRMQASYQLTKLGTNAATALPVIVALVESLDDYVFYSGIEILRFAPGTKYETRALNALLRITALNRVKEWRSDTYAIQAAYETLPAFSSHYHVIIPLMIKSLQVPGGYKRIDAIVQLGTNALPALREAALSETNHVRPATVALERILASRSL